MYPNHTQPPFPYFPHPFSHAPIVHPPYPPPYPPYLPFPHNYHHPPDTDIDLAPAHAEGEGEEAEGDTLDPRNDSLPSPPPAAVSTDPTPPTKPSPSTSASPAPAPAPVASTSKPAARTPFVPPPPPPPLSDPLALLLRSQSALSQLVTAGNIDARPSRQGPAPPAKSGACQACRGAKAKCSQDTPRCTRCVQHGTECSYVVMAKRGRKRNLTPNQVLLENVARDVEVALSLLTTQGLSPLSLSSSTPSASSSSRPPSLPRPAASTLAAPSLPPIADTPMPPAPSLPVPPSTAPAPTSTSTDSDPDPDPDPESARGLKSIIESPLAVLAHISSLKVGESTVEESGSGQTAFLPRLRQGGEGEREGERQGAKGEAEGYFATGLYQLRSDADPALDPVNLGLLSEADLDRLVGLYFTHLRPFFLHLYPSLHTPRFLRDVSPFLTTSLAYTCATFDPQSRDLVEPLHRHVMKLSGRVWADGLKSLEIVQAFLLLM
ncbi:hypothetical protein JCM10207_002074 [Rhodosporidiobolus poonsookiae]